MDPSADQKLLQEELEKGHQRFKAALNELEIFQKRKDVKRTQMLSLSSTDNH